MFSYCSKLISIDLLTFDLSNVENMESMFFGCSSLEKFGIYPYSYGKINKANNLHYIKYYDFNINIQKVKYMSNLFKECKSLKFIYISFWNLTSVNNISGMFYNCYSLKSLFLGKFYLNNNISMGYLFYNCSFLDKIDLSAFKNTYNIKSMNYLFTKCKSLKEISNLNMTNVENIEYMFWQCSSLTFFNFNNTYKNKVTNMNGLFFECSSLTSINLIIFILVKRFYEFYVLWMYYYY